MQSQNLVRFKKTVISKSTQHVTQLKLILKDVLSPNLLLKVSISVTSKTTDKLPYVELGDHQNGTAMGLKITASQSILAPAIR